MCALRRTFSDYKNKCIVTKTGGSKDQILVQLSNSDKSFSFLPPHPPWDLHHHSRGPQCPPGSLLSDQAKRCMGSCVLSVCSNATRMTRLLVSVRRGIYSPAAGSKWNKSVCKWQKQNNCHDLEAAEIQTIKVHLGLCHKHFFRFCRRFRLLN